VHKSTTLDSAANIAACGWCGHCGVITSGIGRKERDIIRLVSAASQEAVVFPLHPSCTQIQALAKQPTNQSGCDINFKCMGLREGAEVG
jgi:hypothetical protein